MSQEQNPNPNLNLNPNLKPKKKKKKISTSSRNFRAKRNSSKIKKFFIAIVFLTVITLVGMQIFAQIFPDEAILQAPGKTVTSIITPLQTAFSKVTNSVVDYLYKLKYRKTLEDEYNRVVQENETLVYRAMLADELATKLAVYENLYDEISINENLNPIMATVIGRESGNYFSVFTINKGETDGIKEFMAVTMGGALIGYTYNVTDHACEVRTIIDSEASIAGLISNTRDQGTVRGTLGIDGQAMCRMYYLPENSLPIPGDTVATSGVGMSFPKGIPIGTVKESTRGMEGNKQYVVVDPLADFQHIEYVIVLRYQPVAESVETREEGETQYDPIDPLQPIPTIQIGAEFFQLSPTPTPSPVPMATEVGPLLEGQTPSLSTPAPTENDSHEYIAPGSAGDISYSVTIAPTATPSPTPPPLDLSVEED